MRSSSAAKLGFTERRGRHRLKGRAIDRRSSAHEQQACIDQPASRRQTTTIFTTAMLAIQKDGCTSAMRWRHLHTQSTNLSLIATDQHAFRSPVSTMTVRYVSAAIWVLAVVVLMLVVTSDPGTLWQK